MPSDPWWLCPVPGSSLHLPCLTLPQKGSQRGGQGERHRRGCQPQRSHQLRAQRVLWSLLSPQWRLPDAALGADQWSSCSSCFSCSSGHGVPVGRVRLQRDPPTTRQQVHPKGDHGSYTSPPSLLPSGPPQLRLQFTIILYLVLVNKMLDVYEKKRKYITNGWQIHLIGRSWPACDGAWRCQAWRSPAWRPAAPPAVPPAAYALPFRAAPAASAPPFP